MSQYISGVVDYVPQIQPYQPDLNFYQKVLETKNAQYKEGYNKLSSLYGQLLESPLLRSENIDIRNKFFNDIGNQIKRISSMDLSMPQNVEAASQVFQPLIDNKYILKDMAYTKRSYSALEKGERLKNCIDCEEKYWDGGIRAIQYQMMDFAKSSADESLGFNAPSYTPYVNIAEKAMKFAKDMGFNVSNVSWSPDGRYQITTKNGVQMIPSLTNAFLSIFKNDQPAIEYYKTQAYLNRRDYMANMAQEFGSEDAAEKDYLSQYGKALSKTFMTRAAESEKTVNQVDSREKAADAIISSRGVNPDDPKDQSIIATKQQSSVEKLIALSTQEFYKKTAETVSDQVLLGSSLEGERNRIDYAVANELFTNDLYNAAVSYAMNTAEVTDIKADPYRLASYENTLAKDKIKYEYEKKWEFEKNKAALDMLKESVSADGAKESGLPSPNVPVQRDPSASGGSSAVIKDLQEKDRAQVTSTGDDMTNNIAAFAQRVYSNLDKFKSAKQGDVINGILIKTQADADNLRQYAINKQRELFGEAKENTTTKTSVPSSSLVAFGPLAYFFSDREKNTKTEYSGGYIGADGKLIDFSKSTSFRDGNNKKNWFYLNQSLQSAIDSDPIMQSMVQSDLSLNTQRENVNKSINNYNYNKKIQGDNNRIVFNALMRNKDSDFVSALSNAYSPEYALSFVSNYFLKSNNDVSSKQDFINAYANGHPAVKKPKTWTDTDEFGVTLQVPLDPGTYSKEDYKDEAEDLYDKLNSAFVKTYNQGPNAIIGTENMKSILYNFTAGGDGGAGVQQGVVGYDNIDSAFPMDVGAQDFFKVMNTISAARNTGKFYAVVNENGNKITSEYLDDLSDDDLSSGNYLEIIENVKSKMLKGVKTTDGDRPMFSLDYHGIVGNDISKAAFTITLDQGYIEKNKGKENKGLTGAMKNPSITFIMDASAIDPSINLVGVLKRGPEDLEMEATGKVEIKGYPYGGSAVIEPYSNGVYNVTTELYGYDENGQRITFKDSNLSAPNSTPSSIANSLYPMLEQNNMRQYEISEQLRQLGNLSFDPNAFNQ